MCAITGKSCSRLSTAWRPQSSSIRLLMITAALLLAQVEATGGALVEDSTEASTVEYSGDIYTSQDESAPNQHLHQQQLSSSASEEDEHDELPILLHNNNETREALEHDGTHQSSVVYIGDGYVPLSTQLRQNNLLGDQQTQTQQQQNAFLDWRTPGNSQSSAVAGGSWDSRRYFNNKTRVQHIEAECQDDYMKIRIGFNGSFGGLLYSSGYSYDPDCVYINGTGRDYYEFYIQLNRCGTLGKNSRQDDARKNPAKNVMWNTVTVQYNPLIEEEWDEHFKVTCEYGYDFWKTVTFPFLDVEVATGNPVVFTLSPPECYMEIRYGYGTNGNRVAGPVRVGDPLTLIIYMRSKYDGFDIVVNDCYAHNGANKRIQLIDQYGCPVDDKLISRFRGSWSEAGVFETQVFAYMKTFRFTGSPALYIECDVRMCHGRCPSQPCHWRNAKSIQKRSVLADENNNSSLQGANVNNSQNNISQNISLFQSLRVLQEGTDDPSYTNSSLGGAGSLNNSVCLRSGVVTWMVCSVTTVTTILLIALVITCCRLKTVNKQSSQQSILGPSGTHTTPRCFVNLK